MNPANAPEFAQTLFEEIGDAAFVVDPETEQVLDVNPMAQRLTGRSRGSLLRLLVIQLLRSECDNAMPRLQRAMRSTQTFHSQESYSLRRGFADDWIPVNLTLTRLHTDRQPLALILARDITERKQAEESLKASEERYRLLVETIPHIAWRSSPDGLEIECNRRWYDYTGQTPAQVRARGWLAAVHPDDLLRVTEHAHDAEDHRQPYEIEYRLRRASDGAYRWHVARAAPVLDSDGNVVCWIGSASDVEDLKQANELLKQAHHRQLQEHRAELAHVARLSMIGEIAASLVHELNQPLYAVNNYAHGAVRRLLKNSNQDEELVAVLQQIGQEANRAAEIVRRVRRFVQKHELQLSEVSLNDLVEEVVRLFGTELDQRRTRVALCLADDLPSIQGDPIQIEQVIMNLVRNGAEAMEETPQANRCLQIRTMRHSDDAVMLEVCDFGMGIHEEELEKVFEPFFSTKAEGMGMGLAVSQSIVQAHGGCIWASSNPDQGCTFHVALPLGKREPS